MSIPRSATQQPSLGCSPSPAAEHGPGGSSPGPGTRPRQRHQGKHSDRSLAHEIAKVARTWSRSQYELVHLAAHAAESDDWVLEGAQTPAGWIAALVDVESCTAREWIRIGLKLADLAVIDAAFETGDISYAKVRALTRVATPHNEHELLDIARSVPANHLGRALAAWLAAGDDPDALDRWHNQQRGLRWRCDPDGMTTFTLRLPPLTAAMIIAVLTTLLMRAKPRRQPDGTWPTVAQQHGDDLVHLITGQVATVDAEVVIHLHPDTNPDSDPDFDGEDRHDGPAIVELDDGTPLTASTVARVLPTAYLRALVHDAEANPIAVSHRRRHPTPRQKRFVNARDRVCVDCGRHDLLQYDHNPPYDATRHTGVDELELRCGPCHHKRTRI